MVRREDELEALNRREEERIKKNQENISKLIENNRALSASMSRFVEEQRQMITEQGKLTVGESLAKKFGVKSALALGSGSAALTGALTGNARLASIVGGGVGLATGGIGMLGNAIIKRRMLAREAQARQEEKEREREEDFQKNSTRLARDIIQEQRRAEGKGKLSGAALAESIRKSLDDSEFAQLARDRFNEEKRIEKENLERNKDFIERQEKTNKILDDLKELGEIERVRETSKERRDRKEEKISRARSREDSFEKSLFDSPKTETQAQVQAQKNQKASGLAKLLGLVPLGLASGIAGLGGALALSGASAGAIVAGGLAIGAGLGAIFTLGGLGIGAGIRIFSEIIDGSSKGLKDLVEGIQAFEVLDAAKLAGVGSALREFSVLQFIGAAIGKLVNDLSNSEFKIIFDDLSQGIEKFQNLNPDKLSSVGSALSDFPLFKTALSSGILGFVENLTQFISGRSVGEIFGDFAGGLREFEKIQGDKLQQAGSSLKSLGSDLTAFGKTFSQSFFDAIGRSLTDFFGDDLLDVLTKLSEIGPDLKQSAQALKMLNDVDDMNLNFKFEADRNSMNNLVNFAQDIVKRAGPEIDTINKFADSLSTIEKFQFLNNPLSNQLERSLDVNRNLNQRQNGPFAFTPIDNSSPVQINRGGDVFSPRLNSAPTDSTIRRAFN